MIQTLRNAFTIPDLRKKLLYTILIVFIFRVGTAIPVPFVDAEALKSMMGGLTGGDTGNLLSYLNILSGRAFENATIFAMGIGPYITAQIIIQLLTVAIPPLERLAKEGSEGRKKLNNITRITTIGLGIFQGTMYYIMLKSYNVVRTYDSDFQNLYVSVFVVTCFCAGTALVMWLGERITEKGIRNSIGVHSGRKYRYLARQQDKRKRHRQRYLDTSLYRYRCERSQSAHHLHQLVVAGTGRKHAVLLCNSCGVHSFPRYRVVHSVHAKL